MPIFDVKFRFFSGHLFIHFFSYTPYATSYWKDVKGPVQFREKLRLGEALEWAWFGDIRLIGMYFLWWLQPYSNQLKDVLDFIFQN